MIRKLCFESKLPTSPFSLTSVKFPKFPHIICPYLNNRFVKEQVKPLDGLHKIRKWIEDRGLKRAAVTNAPRPNAELMISLLGLSDFFQAVVIGSECDRAKPFPDPYLKALEVLQVSKDNTFIFEVFYLYLSLLVVQNSNKLGF